MSENEDQSPLTEIDFLAIGGVWLDEIHVGDEIISKDAIGGSVTFATLGARMFRGNHPGRVKLVMKAGQDFPPGALNIFLGWKIDLVTHRRLDRLSARGIVLYDRDTSNRVSYTRCTSPLLITPRDLSFIDLESVASFHFFETAASVIEQVRDLKRLFADRPQSKTRLFVWEPQAKSCCPRTLHEHREASAEVHVFSPNHAELYALWGDSVPKILDREHIEARAAQFTFSGCGCVVIRCGEHGCYVVNSKHRKGVWLPAFYSTPSEKVVDPTGAGNAFLGGFTIGYLDCHNFLEAAEYGTIAASFAVEQVGLPQLQNRGNGETWNGANVLQRLEEYRTGLRERTRFKHILDPDTTNLEKDLSH